MEYWDIYDKHKRKTGKIIKRGDALQDEEYHLVVNIWIKNKNNDFLITRRAAKRSFPLMWECTGGSAIKGETSLDAACREVKEELGLNLDRSTGKLLGTTLRYYARVSRVSPARA